MELVRDLNKLLDDEDALSPDIPGVHSLLRDVVDYLTTSRQVTAQSTAEFRRPLEFTFGRCDVHTVHVNKRNGSRTLIGKATQLDPACGVERWYIDPWCGKKIKGRRYGSIYEAAKALFAIHVAHFAPTKAEEEYHE